MTLFIFMSTRQVFEINYKNIIKGEDYYILRHLFVEQDARPLYAWPERDVDGRSDRKRRIREVTCVACRFNEYS